MEEEKFGREKGREEETTTTTTKRGKEERGETLRMGQIRRNVEGANKRALVVLAPRCKHSGTLTND